MAAADILKDLPPCPPDFVPMADYLEMIDSLLLAMNIQRKADAELQQWKARGEAAEVLLAKRKATEANVRLESLRRLLAKGLHPDFCTGGNVEKAVRQEMFKTIWPKVEELIC